MNSMYGGQGAGPTSAGGVNNSTGYYKEKIPKGYSKGKLQQFTPEQIQLFQQGFSHLGPDSYLSRLAGGDQSMFEEMEAPALRQFNELQGNIASRFSGGGGGQGALGARKSSGFQNAMGAETSDFASRLASQRMEMRNQAIRDLMGMSNTLLNQRPYETRLAEKQPKESSGWGSLFGAGLGAAGGFFGGGGDPTMALKGAQLGYKIGSPF